MNPRLDRWGDPIEDEETLDPTSSLERTRDEIHRDRCAQLRRILRDARDRREAQQ